VSEPFVHEPPTDPLLSHVVEDYINLEVVDISCFINEPSFPSVNSQIRRDIVDRAFAGFKDVGFIVLTGHGLDAEMISRQFDIGKMFFDAVTEEEKHNYHAKIAEEGSWAGYKARIYLPPWVVLPTLRQPLGYHKRPNGTRDSTEVRWAVFIVTFGSPVPGSSTISIHILSSRLNNPHVHGPI
jgi:isopenicillin N synthase-like dioxygenase